MSNKKVDGGKGVSLFSSKSRTQDEIDDHLFETIVTRMGKMHCEICAGWGHKAGKCSTRRALARSCAQIGVQENMGRWVKRKVGHALDRSRHLRKRRFEDYQEVAEEVGKKLLIKD